MCHTEQTHYTPCGHWVRTTKICPNQDTECSTETLVYLKQCRFAVLPDSRTEGVCPHCLLTAMATEEQAVDMTPAIAGDSTVSNAGIVAVHSMDVKHLASDISSAHVQPGGENITVGSVNVFNEIVFPTRNRHASSSVLRKSTWSSPKINVCDNAILPFSDWNTSPNDWNIRAGIATIPPRDPEAMFRNGYSGLKPMSHKDMDENSMDSPLGSPLGGWRWSCPGPSLSSDSDPKYDYADDVDEDAMPILGSEGIYGASAQGPIILYSTNPLSWANAYTTHDKGTYFCKWNQGKIFGQSNKYHTKMSRVHVSFRNCCRYGTNRQLDECKGDNVRARLCRNHKNGPCDLSGPCRQD